MQTAKKHWSLTVEVVKRAAGAVGFAVLPHRWPAERIFAHLSNARRTARGYERLEETHEAMVRWSRSPSCPASQSNTKHDHQMRDSLLGS